MEVVRCCEGPCCDHNRQGMSMCSNGGEGDLILLPEERWNMGDELLSHEDATGWVEALDSDHLGPQAGRGANQSFGVRGGCRFGCPIYARISTRAKDLTTMCTPAQERF